MSSIFTRIILGEIPCYKLAETDQAISFLDIRPLALGHALVVPKMEVDQLFDLPEAEYHALFALVRRVSAAQKASITCNRIGLSVLGFEVPHAHIHLVPIRSEADLNFANPKLQLEAHEMEEVAARIRAAMFDLG